MFIGGAVWRARRRPLVTHADVRNLVTRVRGHVTSSLACRRRQILRSTESGSYPSKYPQQIIDALKANMRLRNQTQTWATFHSQEIKQSFYYNI